MLNSEYNTYYIIVKIQCIVFVQCTIVQCNKIIICIIIICTTYYNIVQHMLPIYHN